MKELIEYIAKSLVNYPDQVQVTESSGSGRRVLNLKVAQVDMGKVIGKQGRIAQAMRTLLKVSAARSGRGDSQAFLIIAGTEDAANQAPFDDAEAQEIQEISEDEELQKP